MAGAQQGTGNGFLDALGGVAKSLFIDTPKAILTDPGSFINPEGKVSLTRLLVPGYRDEMAKQEKTKQEIAKVELQNKLLVPIKAAHDWLTQAATPEARNAYSTALGGIGIDKSILSAMGLGASADATAFGNAAGEAGAGPAARVIATRDSANQMANTALSSVKTQENQTQEHGFRLGEQGNAARLARDTYAANADTETRALQTRDEYKRKMEAGDASGAVNTLTIDPLTQPGQPFYYAVQRANELAKTSPGEALKEYDRISAGIAEYAKPKTTAKGQLATTPENALAAIRSFTPDQWKVAEATSPTVAAAARDALTRGDSNAAVAPYAELMKFRAPTANGRSTFAERQADKARDALQRNLAAGTIPLSMQPQAQIALDSGDPELMRGANKMTLAAADPKAVNWIPAAKQWLAKPENAKMMDDVSREALSQAIDRQDRSYVNAVMPSLAKGKIEAGKALLTDKGYNAATDALRDNSAIRHALTTSATFATSPTDPKKWDDRLFDPTGRESLMFRSGIWTKEYAAQRYGDLAPKKLGIVAGAIDARSRFTLSRTGKVMNQTEMAEYANLLPTGLEPNSAMYAAKLNVVTQMLRNEARLTTKYMKARGDFAESHNRKKYERDIANLTTGNDAAMREGGLRSLARLKAIETDPKYQSNADLTPEEQAAAVAKGLMVAP